MIEDLTVALAERSYPIRLRSRFPPGRCRPRRSAEAAAGRGGGGHRRAALEERQGPALGAMFGGARFWVAGRAGEATKSLADLAGSWIFCAAAGVAVFALGRLVAIWRLLRPRATCAASTFSRCRRASWRWWTAPSGARPGSTLSPARHWSFCCRQPRGVYIATGLLARRCPSGGSPPASPEVIKAGLLDEVGRTFCRHRAHAAADGEPRAARGDPAVLRRNRGGRSSRRE